MKWTSSRLHYCYYMNTFLWSEHPVSIIVIIWTHFCEVNIIPSPLLLLYEHISVKWILSRLHYSYYINTFLWSEHPISIIGIILLTHFCEVNIPSPLLALYLLTHFCEVNIPSPLLVLYLLTHFCEVNIPSPLLVLYLLTHFCEVNIPSPLLVLYLLTHFCEVNIPSPLLVLYLLTHFCEVNIPSPLLVLYLLTHFCEVNIPSPLLVLYLLTHFCEVNIIPSPLLLLYEHISVKWTSRLHYCYYMNTFLWSEHPVSIIVIIWTHFCEVNIPSPLLLLYEHISVKWTSRLHYCYYMNTFLWSEHPVSIIVIIWTHFCEVNIIPSPLLLLYEHISVKWTSRLHYCYYMNTFLWSEHPVSIIVIIWTHFCEVNIPSPLLLLYEHISVKWTSRLHYCYYMNTFLWSEHPVSIIVIIWTHFCEVNIPSPLLLLYEHISVKWTSSRLHYCYYMNTFLWSEHHPVSIIVIIWTHFCEVKHPVSIIVIIWTHFCEVNIPSPLLLLYEHISVKWTSSRLHYCYYMNTFLWSEHPVSIIVIIWTHFCEVNIPSPLLLLYEHISVKWTSSRLHYCYYMNTFLWSEHHPVSIIVIIWTHFCEVNNIPSPLLLLYEHIIIIWTHFCEVNIIPSPLLLLYEYISVKWTSRLHYCYYMNTFLWSEHPVSIIVIIWTHFCEVNIPSPLLLLYEHISVKWTSSRLHYCYYMNTFLWSEHPVSIIVIIWTHFCEVNIPSPLLLLYEHISVKWTSHLHYCYYMNTFLWSEHHPVSIIVIIWTHFCEVNIPSPLLLLYEHISVKWTTSRLHYYYYINTFLWSEHPVSIIVIILTHFCEVNIIPSPLLLLYEHISVKWTSRLHYCYYMNTFLWSGTSRLHYCYYMNTFLWSEHHPVSIYYMNTFLWSEHIPSPLLLLYEHISVKWTSSRLHYCYYMNTFLWSEHPVSIIIIILTHFCEVNIIPSPLLLLYEHISVKWTSRLHYWYYYMNTFLWSEHPVSIIVIIWTHFCEVNIPSPLLLLYEHISVKWTSRLHYWYYIILTHFCEVNIPSPLLLLYEHISVKWTSRLHYCYYMNTFLWSEHPVSIIVIIWTHFCEVNTHPVSIIVIIWTHFCEVNIPSPLLLLYEHISVKWTSRLHYWYYIY